MIYAKVLCGKVCEMGQRTAMSLVRPPDGYHSVRGGLFSVAGPWKAGDDGYPTMMRVVYDLSQVYPGYVVTYSRRAAGVV